MPELSAQNYEDIFYYRSFSLFFCTLMPFAVVADSVGIAGHKPQVGLAVRVKGEFEIVVDESLPAAERQDGAALLASGDLHGLQGFLEIQPVVLHIVLVHDAHIGEMYVYAVSVDGERIAIGHAARTPAQWLHVSDVHFDVARIERYCFV